MMIPAGTLERALRRAASSPWTWLVLATVLSALPVLVVDMPPVIDFPSHLARVQSLLEITHLNRADAFFEPNTWLLPNVGLDASLYALLIAFPWQIATKLYFVMLFAAMIGGVAFLHAATHSRTSLWPFISAIFVFNWIFLYGFLSYLQGLALAYWAIGCWIAGGGRAWPARALIGGAFVTALFFTHLVALGIYGLCIMGLELHAALASSGWSVRDRLRRLGVAAVQFLPALPLWYLSPANEVASGKPLFLWLSKVRSALFTPTAGAAVVDTLTALSLGLLAVFIFWLVRSKRAVLSINRGLAASWSILFIAFLALPRDLGWTAYIDSRIPIALLFLAIATVDLRVDERSHARILACSVVLLLSVRTLLISWQWSGYGQIISQYQRAFDKLSDNAVLHVAREAPLDAWRDKFYRERLLLPFGMGPFASLDKEIFSPDIFADARANPLRPRQSIEPLTSLALGYVTDRSQVQPIAERLLHLNRSISPEHDVFLLLQGDNLVMPIPVPCATRIASGDRFELLLLGQDRRPGCAP